MTMPFRNDKLRLLTILVFILFVSFSSPAQASEWAKKEGYFPRIGAKFVFGLKYIVFSFFTPFLESNEPEYQREWEGFCAGIGKAVVFEAAGIIQLVTFPIPVDIPDVGIGLHLPNKDCPMRHNPHWKQSKPDSKKDLTAVPPLKIKEAKVSQAPAPAEPAPAAPPAAVPPAPNPAPKAPLIVEVKPSPAPTPDS